MVPSSVFESGVYAGSTVTTTVFYGGGDPRYLCEGIFSDYRCMGTGTLKVCDIELGLVLRLDGKVNEFCSVLLIWSLGERLL